ncbi:LysE family transporter, partial [Bacillus spizizenii]|uniref:LysE family transporter n=1 Tax=Bacillus spizizenii TaxID=96241 RepID=UPI002816697C
MRSSRGEVSDRKPVAAGFRVALSSPLRILFWLGIYGGILAGAAEACDMRQLLGCSCGRVGGGLLWGFCMAVAAGGGG